MATWRLKANKKHKMKRTENLRGCASRMSVPSVVENTEDLPL